jgi:hypothetical protein
MRGITTKKIAKSGSCTVRRPVSYFIYKTIKNPSDTITEGFKKTNFVKG